MQFLSSQLPFLVHKSAELAPLTGSPVVILTSKLHKNRGLVTLLSGPTLYSLYCAYTTISISAKSSCIGRVSAKPSCIEMVPSKSSYIEVLPSKSSVIGVVPFKPYCIGIVPSESSCTGVVPSTLSCSSLATT